MTTIERNPNAICSERFDIIVVGGGIYGSCLTLEASRRGLKVLLLERDDYGGATSLNSLRIVHGGLRYLQYADLSRFRRSVTEQAWWLTHFPELVKPLSCLMPLYDRGLKRRSIMQAALALNNWMARSVRRVTGYNDIRLDDGRVIGPEQAVRRFPSVDSSDLQGAAIWHDARMTSPQRLLIEVLRWASACGAKSLNYLECTGLIQHQGRVQGVCAKCGVTDREFEFEAENVVNCAGPWVTDIASLGGMKIDRESGLTLAYNLIANRKPLAADALALTAKKRAAPTYFMVPSGQSTIIGTVHLVANELLEPTEEQLSDFLAELNSLIPDYDLRRSEVTEVLAGRLPATHVGSHLPAKSPRILHHQSAHGPTGLTSVIGVKYTTARHLAERTLREIKSRRGQDLLGYSGASRPAPATRPKLSADRPTARDLQEWIRSESVVHIDDLLLRRCDLAIDLEQRFQLAADVMKLAGWDDPLSNELKRLGRKIDSDALRTQC